MRKYLYFIFLFFLASCSTCQLPPFGTQDKWRLRDGAALNLTDSIMIDFTGKGSTILANSSNGDYDLNFVVNKEGFDGYSLAYARYLKDIIKSLPLKIDSIEVILADQYLVLSTSAADNLMPDYIRRADGAKFLVQANPIASTVQPDDELWRNLLFDNKKGQILVVDRIIRNGHHYAIVYVLQSEKKDIPHVSPYHYNLLDCRNMQFVGTHLDYLMDISFNAINSKVQ